jgi:hypothetical protein
MLYKRTKGALKSPNESGGDRDGLPRAGALRPHGRETCRSAGLGSSFRHIWMSSPVAEHAGQPGPRGWETASEKRPGIFISVRLGAKSATPEEPRNNTKIQLARAIAQGDSVTEWPCTKSVPSRTAFKWAKDPGVGKAVEAQSPPHDG